MSFLIVVYEQEWNKDCIDNASSVADLRPQQVDEVRNALLTAIFTSPHFTAASLPGVQHRGRWAVLAKEIAYLGFRYHEAGVRGERGFVGGDFEQVTRQLGDAWTSALPVAARGVQETNLIRVAQPSGMANMHAHHVDSLGLCFVNTTHHVDATGRQERTIIVQATNLKGAPWADDSKSFPLPELEGGGWQLCVQVVPAQDRGPYGGAFCLSNILLLPMKLSLIHI